jgi:pantothenate kinase-related protein Tda10
MHTRRTPGASAAIPFYDKSLRGGRGDRAPAASWPAVRAPLRVVCLEGWSLGFAPLPTAAAAAAVHPSLPAVNEALRAYAASIESRVDAWVVVRVGDPNWVFSWRLQAEVEMRAAGKPGLSDEQVADFVSRFMPAYKAYLPVRLPMLCSYHATSSACVFLLTWLLFDAFFVCASRFITMGQRGVRACRAWRSTLTPRACSSARSEARRCCGAWRGRA